MTPSEIQAGTEIAGSILHGNMVGFFIMLLAIGGMAYAIYHLWGFVQSQLEILREDLGECQKQHGACQQANQKMAAALIDMLHGRFEQARDKASKILSGE